MAFNKAIHLGASWTPTIGSAALLADKSAAFAGTPYTHSSITFTAGLVVLGIAQQSSGQPQTINSVTIKGVTATKLAEVVVGADNVAIWAAEVTAGSGSIVMNNGGNNLFNLNYIAWTLTGYTSATPVSTPTWDGMTAQQADPQGPISSLTVPAGGWALIVMGHPFATANSMPVTWAQATRDATLEVEDLAANGCAIAGAHIGTPGTYTGITATGGAGGLEYSAMVAAVFH